MHAMRAPWIPMTLAVAAAALTGASCLRSTTFTCEADPDCSDGVCELNGYCSFADSSCTSGRRYGGLSGPVADQCVGGEDQPDAADPADAAIDAPPGTPDAPPGGCPGTYGPLAGAPNVYRLIATPASWVDQQIACVADGGYMAIPDDAGELDAIATLAATVSWVGISDTATEGSWVTVQGSAATFLPWAAGQPDDDPPGEDCVQAATATELSDERCNGQKRAVCECVP